MRLSRLRLRLAGGFALAFFAGLIALALVALGLLWRDASGRVRAQLEVVARGGARTLVRELNRTPDSSMARIASNAVHGWPAEHESFAIVDERGTLLAAADRAHIIDSVMAGFRRSRGAETYTVYQGEDDYRVVVLPVTQDHPKPDQRLVILAYASVEGLEADVERLGGSLALAVPLIALFSLGAGYLFAGRALRPMQDLRAAVRSIAPTDLAARLPVAELDDEIGALTTEFNALLSRLEESQERNRRFVREAAHQIRTPLTIILGEATIEASPNAAPEESGGALRRIRTAAEHMRRRVDELFLLAEAQSGVPLDDDVELDALVLECTDLMRARASALGRTLAIGAADPVSMRGNTALLREAVLELIENGCRHGNGSSPITVSSRATPGAIELTVESSGEPIGAFPDPASATAEGLGLLIVQWIARVHGGEVSVTRASDRNIIALRFRET
ncbi:MAG TPA: HAMP domain-containing sensor histidine kinase [Gemmatimonadaceae bacterium]|nr:HAMP domain-containing sensor histidine kinase [Gemmatimonadaceae bacterium]